jgi:Lantibiotic dehydratase, N terminus
VGDRAGADGEPRLLPIADGWRLWSSGVLRYAGLPAERALDLAGSGEGAGFASEEAVRAGFERFALDPWCREAVTLQSPAVVENWFADLSTRLRAGDGSVSRRARKEAMVALYLQRYATKNDTIGFFGPVSWVRLCPEQRAALALGEEVELDRRTHLEAWAADALARRWEADPALREHLRARRDPSARLDGTRLEFPRRPAVELSVDEAAVLALCDRPMSASELLAALRAANPELGFERVSEVQSVLAALQGRGCVTRGFHLPLDERMDEHLLEQVESVPDPVVRERFAVPLRGLRERMAAVTAAAGDPDAVLAAVRDLEQAYGDLTDAEPRRSKDDGAMGRTLVWQDTLRSWGLVVGGPPLERVAPVLGLVLDACRWITWRVAAGVREAANARLRASGQGSLPFAHLLLELAPELRGDPGTALDRVVSELQATAGAILRPGAGPEAVRSFDEVAGPWREAFAAPGPGWTAARLHSPDLLLAGAGPDAIERGELRWVLGEVHVAVNTIENRCFVVNEEERGTVRALVERSLPATRYIPAFPRNWPELTQRAYPPLTIDLPDRYVHWALEPSDTLPEDATRVPCAGWQVVADAARGPRVVSPGTGLDAPLTEVIGELLCFAVGNVFRPLAPAPHVPRVTIGDVVLRRESWTVPARPLRAAASEAALARALRASGLPRFTFARVPGEPKPVLCDLRSAPLLRAIQRILRRSDAPDGDVAFSEMLPWFGDLWLRDAAGRGHTSELRLVAVDDRPVPEV